MILIGNAGLCTGTLVGQRTVVTAAHCIQPGVTHTFVAGGATFPASSVHTHPGWNPYTLSNDIALVLLAQAPGIPSMPVATSAPSPGQQITLVGFGVTSDNQTNSGVKRVAYNNIQEMDSTHFNFAGSGGQIGSTCYGDSGGPAFATLDGAVVQVGVTSSGQEPCGTLAFDTRVDVYVQWMEDTTGGDLNEGEEVAPPPPANSDPEVVILSPSAGATVSTSLTVSATISDDKAVVRGELAVDGQLVGTLTAAPFNFSTTLTAGIHQLRVTGFDAEGAQGTADVTVTAAAPAPADPGPQPAQDPGQDPGAVPEEPTGKEPGQVPAAAVQGDGEYGAPCTSPEECNSGMCAADPGQIGQYCTATCVPDGAPCPMDAGCYPTIGNKSYVCGAPQAALPASPATASQSPEGEILVGGCQLGGQGGELPGWVMILGLLLLVRRRGA